MIPGDSVESTAVSCVTLGSHAGRVYRPANSADPHLKRREREMNFSQRSFKFGLPNLRWLTRTCFFQAFLFCNVPSFQQKILGSYTFYKLVKGATECE